MATSALAAVSRTSRRLSISPSTLSNASTPRFFQEIRSVLSAQILDEGRQYRWAPTTTSHQILTEGRHYRWAPTAVLAEQEKEKCSSVNWALRVIGTVSLVVLSLTIFSTDAALCDGAELQTATPDDPKKSPEVAKKMYYLLADSYRRQVFFNYERRIRLRSRPEKVFGYFASQRDSEGQPYMTPTDLMRAVVPVFPPADSTAIREGNLQGERSPGELSCAPSEFFMLFDTNGDGLISFAEYIFFQTLLSIPEKEFRAAFKMFDLDDNGLIDRDEFKEVMRRMRERTRQGLAQQTALHSALTVSIGIENCGLVEHFFGKDGKKQLPHEDFEKFLRKLHDEVIPWSQ
jgi:hypothetical protein